MSSQEKDGIIKAAETEYNNLRQFAAKFDYPKGQCKSLLDLFPRLKLLTEKLANLNEDKLTKEQLVEFLFEQFRADINSYYAEKKAIIEQVIIKTEELPV